MAREGEKHKLSSMVETREGFEYSTVCLNPKVVKIHMSSLNEPRRVNFMTSTNLQTKVSKNVSEKGKRGLKH